MVKALAIMSSVVAQQEQDPVASQKMELGQTPWSTKEMEHLNLSTCGTALLQFTLKIWVIK